MPNISPMLNPRPMVPSFGFEVARFNRGMVVVPDGARLCAASALVPGAGATAGNWLAAAPNGDELACEGLVEELGGRALGAAMALGSDDAVTTDVPAEDVGGDEGVASAWVGEADDWAWTR